MIRAVLIAAAAAVALCLPTTVAAVVPPKNCGMKTVKGKRYQVKADQISCRKGRRYVKRFIRRGTKPAGYRCKDYPSKKGRVDFYCNKGRKIYFAIRR